MNDREPLEMAAKAAGISGWWSGDDYCYGHNGNLNVPVPWRPLADDGDALRLAVSLLIQVVQDRMGFVKVGWSVGFDSGTPSMDGRGPWYLKEWLSDHSGDRQAATRRAIVRAAAEIGRNMT